MSEPLYTVETTVEKVEGVHRSVTLPSGHRFDVGVHGPIKAYYRLEREADRPLPVDYLVGAAGA